MYKPDRAIVKKVKAYDPFLYFKWNDRKEYFELWREMVHGHRLITPLTQSIYDPKRPIKFCQMDERILWWLQAADSWRSGGSSKHAMEGDRRWREFTVNNHKRQNSFYRDMAKDCYSLANYHFATKHKTVNPKHHKHTKKSTRKFLRPDSQSRSAPRVWGRTADNARKYLGK